MPTTVSTLGIVSSIPGNILLSNGVDPSVHEPSFYLIPNLNVVIVNSNGGQTVTLRSIVLEVTINYGFDIGVSTAEIQFTEDPTSFFTLGLANYSSVVIFGGTDQNGPNYNASRFSGLFLRTEATLWPHVYTMVCRGNLYRAIQYRQAAFAGLPGNLLPEGSLPGVPVVTSTDSVTGAAIPGWFGGTLGTNSTDQNLVVALLQTVPNLAVVPANIGGTSNQFVASLFDLMWPPYKSAWEMVTMFDQVCLGYRTYEDVGGVIRRVQVFGYPMGNGDTTFTEGIDIWEAHGSRSIEPLVNGVYVEGMVDSRSGLSNGIIFAYLQSSNPFQPSSEPIIEQFRSPLIETSDLIESGSPSAIPLLNADRVAEWRMAEGNRQLVNINLTTFRDDLLKIGHTIAVLIPHAAVTEPVWIQHVTIRISSEPALFQQTITCIGGGVGGFVGSLTGSGSSSSSLHTTTTYVNNSLAGLAISITDPTDTANLGQSRTISSNSSNVITVSSAFPATPVGSATYAIGTLPPP